MFEILIETMSKCFFCGLVCKDENDKDGVTGSKVGNKMICGGCLIEFRSALDIGDT